MPSFDKDLNWLFEEMQRVGRQSEAPAEIRAVLVHDQKVWHNYATRLEVPALFPAELQTDPEPQIFPSLALLRKTVPLEDIKPIEALQHQLSSWPELDAGWEMDLQESLHVTFWGSHNRYHHLPVWVLELHNRKENAHFNPPNGPFLDPCFPIYNSVPHAAAVWLKDPYIEENYKPPYSYRSILASSKATIEDLQLQDDALLVQIKAFGALDDLWCKVMSRDPEGKEIQATQKAAEQIRFDMPAKPQELMVYLIDDSGQPHDVFEETPYRSSWPTSVLEGRRRAKGEAGWLEEIQRGEGVMIEFKEWLPTKTDNSKRWELHETVVAFANTKGGTIYVGVDNHGELKGVDRQLHEEYGQAAGGKIGDMLSAYEKDLRLAINDEVEPDIKVDFERLRCGHQTLLAIYVFKGHDTPYSIISKKDVYIRRGANNMKPTPNELRQLVQSQHASGL